MATSSYVEIMKRLSVTPHHEEHKTAWEIPEPRPEGSLLDAVQAKIETAEEYREGARQDAMPRLDPAEESRRARQGNPIPGSVSHSPWNMNYSGIPKLGQMPGKQYYGGLQDKQYEEEIDRKRLEEMGENKLAGIENAADNDLAAALKAAQEQGAHGSKTAEPAAHSPWQTPTLKRR